MKYRSFYSKDELTKRWDEITSPARFAGAHEELDWVYNASRKGDRVKLVKKPRASYDPYATVFRGKIEGSKTGGRIRGIYTKGVFDYIVTLLIAVVYFGVCANQFSRVSDRTVPMMLMSIGMIVILFLLIPFPGKRKKYGDLIREVTGPAPDKKYVPAPEAPEAHEAPETPAAEPEPAREPEEKDKYKFRVFGRKK